MRLRRRSAGAPSPASGHGRRRPWVRRRSEVLDGTEDLPGDARAYLDERIAELSAAGALDEGTGGLLDELIESWRVQHHELIEFYYLRQRDLAERELGTLRARVAAAEHRLQETERRVAAAQALLDGAPVAGPLAAATDEGALGVPAPREPQEEAA